MLAATRPDRLEALRRVARAIAKQPLDQTETLSPALKKRHRGDRQWLPGEVLLRRLCSIAYSMRNDADAYAAIGRLICAISNAATRAHLQGLRNDPDFMARCGHAAVVEAEVDERKEWREDHMDRNLGTY